MPTFADYRANHDPALEAVLSYDPDALARDVLAALAIGDARRAEAAAHRHATLPINRFTPIRSQLNALGYTLLQHDRVEDAIVIFRLNVEQFPESSNVYDSLGEAYMVHGDRAMAIENYRRSLELNPDNQNAKDKLKALGAGH